jgi:hypothetical protein
VGSVAIKSIVIGGLVFIAIALFEQIPVLGWLGWLISIGVWIWLTNRLIRQGATHLATSDNPSVPAMGWAGLVGLVTGLVGALASLVIEATKASTTVGTTTTVNPTFGSVGATLGLFYWPVVGAIVMGLFGLIWGGRAKAQAASSPHP